MYRVIRDYYTEGWKFADEQFETVEGAVSYAVKSGYSAPFLIVKVIDWKAIEI